MLHIRLTSKYQQFGLKYNLGMTFRLGKTLTVYRMVIYRTYYFGI